MHIKPKSATITLAKLLDQLDGGVVKVNPKYQRSGQVWPPHAKSFLVETILDEMPIPRVLLHDLDRVTDSHASDIIDGQQRCTVLQQFRDGKFALTTSPDNKDLHGKRFEDLSGREKGIFNTYVVHLDRYEGITQKQIREVFRRLNYYTAPLNAAEQRHAQFYGEFSRFIEEQVEIWSSTLQKLKVFTPKQANRKAMEQLLAEVVDAMLYGVNTPTAASLRKVFQQHERRFSSAGDFGRRLAKAKPVVEARVWLGRSPLRKHYHVFSLVMAALHATTPLASLQADLHAKRPLSDDSDIDTALHRISQAVRDKNPRGKYGKYWIASQEKTNTRANRLIRTRFMYSALTGYEFSSTELRTP